MKLIDPDHPFFARPWARWGTVLVPAIWAVAELFYGSPGWALLSGAAAVYAFWILILKR
ncbi:hypothetical protein [Frigidibacter sp. ROC022]|uniref:hypothetical protein n=1 Tax=Frigidibacter sp. ROC022 TaxID=2971796 RepID=UPI00215B1A2C|nr:hypothetical protein [Frigidibacter sp. ROC022]MCR8722681.1 hypothetical protein [Frigidibacter sp. ROC022]